MNRKDYNIGDKVHYIPYKDAPKSSYENGIIKEIPEHSLDSLRVVYHCDNKWDNYRNYTSALTKTTQLKPGWK